MDTPTSALPPQQRGRPHIRMTLTSASTEGQTDNSNSNSTQVILTSFANAKLAKYINILIFKFQRPSYVGLSCAVSGYSPFTRYTSPDGRKRTPPEQIPVSSPPQTLDSVQLVLNQQNNMRTQNQVRN